MDPIRRMSNDHELSGLGTTGTQTIIEATYKMDEAVKNNDMVAFAKAEEEVINLLKLYG